MDIQRPQSSQPNNNRKKLLNTIFGKVVWLSPPWLQQLKQSAYTSKIYLLKVLLIFLALMGILSGVYTWHKNLPKPQLTAISITTPKPTQIPAQNQPYPTADSLTITFSKSVAPLNLIGKEITKGVKLSPELSGDWVWQDDKTLHFTPSSSIKDWSAAQKYTVIFAKNLFALNKAPKLKKRSLEFTTQPLAIDIKEFKFYQDPLNPKQRQAIATLEFNYPIEQNSLEKNIVLQKLISTQTKLNASALQIPFAISYDKFKRTAYLKSTSLQLENNEYYLQLILNKNIRPINGNPTTETNTKTLLIPNQSSFFKIVTANTSIVRNQQDRPEQILTIETSAGVTSNEFNKAVKVYLLPKDYPAATTTPSKENYEWHNPGEITNEILQQSSSVKVAPIAPDREYPTLHSYKIDLPQQGYLYVSIAKGIKAYGDYTLTNSYQAIVKTLAYPKEISFLHSGSILALDKNNEQKISIITRGISAAKITAARILPNAINHLVSQTEGDFNNPSFKNYTFDQNNISEIFNEVITLNNTNPSTTQYYALDLSKYLNSKNNLDGPRGLFLVQIQEWDPIKKQVISNDSSDKIQAKKLILITNLGLLVKNNADDSHEIFVESIAQGEPTANAEVVALGKNGLPIMSQISDLNGHVSFPNLQNFQEEREPIAYLAKTGSDVSFIPYDKSERELNYSRYDTSGIIDNQNDSINLNAFLFTERGIYRPGDTVHIAAIVKRPFAEHSPAGLPLEITIRDPRGQVVKDQKISLNEIGYLALDFPTSATSLTGQYDINLFSVKDNQPYNVIGNSSIALQEFLPDRMHITAHFDPVTTAGWTNPQNLKAHIQLQNLYGAPAAKRRISGTIVLSPQTVKFDQYANYIFVDPLLDTQKTPKSYSEKLSDCETDVQGQAEFSLNLERFDKATYQLILSLEGFEAQGGRSVKTKITTLVSHLSHLVGYKPDGDFNFIRQNSKHIVNFVAIDPQLKMQKLANLSLEIYAKQPITTLIKNPDGTFQYQSIIEKQLINRSALNIDNKDTVYNLDTTKIGNFEVTLKNQGGVKLCQFDYSVVGASQQPIPKNAELNVKLNKTDYAKNEDITLQITAPYSGAGLITIERDKVYAYKWFKTTTTSSVQTIHIPKELQGNGYVNVAFVRDFNSQEIFISPLSYSVNPFTVSAQDHNINITLQTAKEALSGTAFPIKYKSDKPSKIIVFAVDEGILQVSKYKTPDPLGFFFQKRSLDVRTQQILDQILPKYIASRELSAVGGDGGAQMEIDKNLNPFKRKIDAPVVYWSDILDSDENERQVIYQVPDYFNGSLRIMAVAVAANAVGAAATNANISNYFVINPNTPTFVAPNDNFEITASIANNAKDLNTSQPIQIQLMTSSNLEILDATQKQLNIAPNNEATVSYKLHAKDLLGNATLQFIASSGNKSSKISATISIRPANPYRTSILSGYTNDTSKAIVIDRELYPKQRKVQVVSSTSPLILLTGLQDFLENYPYLCSEQLISKAFATLALAQKPFNAMQQNPLREKVQEIIQLLLQRQASNGSFSYWFNSDDSLTNRFVSIYAVHFLTEAKAQGYNVPVDTLNSGISYLKEIAGKDVNNLEQARLQAYAIYILTRNEIITTNYLTHLQLYLEQNATANVGNDSQHNWKRDITSAYLAATHQLLQNTAESQRLIKLYQPNNKEEIAQNFDFYSKSINDAQYLYLIALHFPQLLSNLTQKLLFPLVDSLNDSSLNTVFSANASLALAAYDRANNTADKNHSSTNIDEKEKRFILENPLKNLLFYQLTQQGFDKELPKKSMSSGIEVFREYRVNNKVVTSAKLGDEIEVHIQVRSSDNAMLSNIAIVDLLPGGFEIVRESVNTQDCDYIDTREDRVIFFCSAEPRAKELVYRIKATNTGEFTIPPISVVSMYNPKRTAHGIAGKIEILDFRF